MRVSVHVAELDLIVNVDVSPDCTVADLKAAVACEFPDGDPRDITRAKVLKDAKQIPDASSLRDAGVVQDDLLIVSLGASGGESTASADARALAADGSAVNAQAMMESFRGNAGTLEALRRQGGSELVDCIEANDVEGFQRMMREMRKRMLAAREQEAEEMALMTSDPFDVEAQRKIEERIRQEQVLGNFATAMEETPEAFAQVVMLYVDLEVNGVALKAFVDSGAQMSIMSVTCARQCGLERLIDKRFSGIAKGVGTQNIIGRVHQAPMKVGEHFLPCAITVLEKEQDMDFIFGLDMLRRHACSIDLRKNALVIGSVDVELPFLSESEIGKTAQEAFQGKAPEAAIPTPSAAVPTPSAAVPTPSTTPSSSSAHDEEKIARLTALGFSRQQVIDALNATSGNEEFAGALLFG
jgi:DNA damage-inducible protein 1